MASQSGHKQQANIVSNIPNRSAIPGVLVWPSSAESPISSTAKIRVPAVSWTDEMNEALLINFNRYLCEGLQADTGWKPTVWPDIVPILEVLNKSAGRLDQEKVNSKLMEWKKKYDTYRWLRDQSGFGWDSEQRLITAPDNVWNDVCRVSQVHQC